MQRTFDYIYFHHGMMALRDVIKHCQDSSHIQQVAFSTYHDALTQICFNCRVIRSMILIREDNGNDE